MMKRLSAIFFLFIFLNANTALGEILKLPILIHHYFEHAQENKRETIFSFIAQHYKGNFNHHHQGNHNDHEKLPFKTLNSHAIQVVSMMPHPFITISQIIFKSPDLKIPGDFQQHYANAYLSTIWQPPRIS